ncbi:MAG: dienelactone hydrolase family protein [Vicingus serpentipes]|nr:dienelactone hydrolase family protein [Vicingus serpentipes]
MKHNIKVNRTAQYYTLGNLEAPKSIWFVLHGYGYSAKYFIKKFEPILTDNILVVAPEGLSKFYLNGVNGRVGASWMTKENREEEIDDYIDFLNRLYAVIIGDNSNVKINIVGFSQGGATASRWLANGNIKCANFILWASFFPEDMEIKSIANNTNTFVLYGDDDEYITEDWAEKQEQIIQQSNIKYQLIKFKGKHDIPADVLKENSLIYNW